MDDLNRLVAGTMDDSSRPAESATGGNTSESRKPRKPTKKVAGDKRNHRSARGHSEDTPKAAGGSDGASKRQHGALGTPPKGRRAPQGSKPKMAETKVQDAKSDTDMNRQKNRKNGRQRRKDVAPSSNQTVADGEIDLDLHKGSEPTMCARSRHKQKEHIPYPSYWSQEDCMSLYLAKDPLIVRGKIRVLPAKNGKAFVSCDRGHFGRDILVESSLDQNRALDGDTVFVELYAEEKSADLDDLARQTDSLSVEIGSQEQLEEEPHPTWQDDPVQRVLWNPSVVVRRIPDGLVRRVPDEGQRRGKVVLVVHPKETAGTQPSELISSDRECQQRVPRRTIVGSIARMLRAKGDLLVLSPNNKSLPQFLCPSGFNERNGVDNAGTLYKAEYEYGTWQESHRWPSCVNVVRMGASCNVEDETLALLIENDVNHGDFSSAVLRDVDDAVDSGITTAQSSDCAHELGWRPTAEMYEGRRDYREERIFTIDPTTAKDLDDALHVRKLPNGRIEIGVHIADVSHFVKLETAVDLEAQRRATTVYLVDRTVPMLPRPLCEVACSLNENVERLAFSCVWQMNTDGTMANQDGSSRSDVWYGRTVVKSCARLDYSTAQNIIENKVATGEASEDMDEGLWPTARRPTGGHTTGQIASDVRLMHVVAMARRRLRFQNGAIALNGIKLAFKLESDGETPMLCAPYPIWDSNRLVEEYMLLANFLVAQRLISHAGGLALLRHHPPPLMLGIESVVKVAKEGMGFNIDATSSKTLQESLSHLGRECDDDLVLQCVTEMLTAPMQPAEYVAAGEIIEEEWRHFALNIPYYTHFTSPIRRYADVIVHRLLQATLDSADMVESFPMSQQDVHSVASHCNEKRMGAKKAQERSDRVFLALYLRQHPMRSELGVCLSVGEKTFTVFVPSLGTSLLLYLDDHRDILTFKPFSIAEERRIRLTQKTNLVPIGSHRGNDWDEIEVKVFTKLRVSCHCKEKAPIDVKVRLEGPWMQGKAQ